MKEAWFIEDAATDPVQLPDEQGWRRVALPHQWTLDPAVTPGIEVGWYSLDFPQVEERRWGEVRADYYTDAWLWSDARPTGVFLGHHEGYFEPWLLEVPPGETLLLRVAAPIEDIGTVWPNFKRQIKGVLGQHDCRPGAGTPRGQELGSGGLWGGVRYFRTGPDALLHLDWRAARTETGWKLWIELEVDSAEVPLQRRVHSEPVTLTLSPRNFQGEAYSIQRSLDLTCGRHTYDLVWDLPDLPRWEVWDQGFPHLYDLKVDLDDQALSTTVGFRTLEMDGDWLLLNGKRVFIRGTNVIPTQWLSGYSPDDAQRDVLLVREAHLNAVRVHAHLTQLSFYDACDQNGVLVWQDFPLQWGYADDETFAQEAVRQVKAMVRHYGSHASIYLWCAHNEPTHNRHTLDPILSAALRQADSTRLVKEASNFREHTYPGWYWGNLRDYLATPCAPLPSEFGAQGLPSADQLRLFLGPDAWPPNWQAWVFHDFQPDETFRVARIEMGNSLEEFVANSQEYQARLIRFATEAYRRAKGRVTGYFQFMFVEPWESITWAVLDHKREPKAGYFALKEASSPVLLSIVPYREQLEPGRLPVEEVWIVNDLDHPLDLRVSLRLEGPDQVSLGDFEAHIGPQASACIFQIGEFNENAAVGKFKKLAQDLQRISAGTYQLIGEAWKGETLVSRREITLEYVAPILSTGRNW